MRVNIMTLVIINRVIIIFIMGVNLLSLQNFYNNRPVTGVLLDFPIDQALEHKEDEKADDRTNRCKVVRFPGKILFSQDIPCDHSGKETDQREEVKQERALQEA